MFNVNRSSVLCNFHNVILPSLDQIILSRWSVVYSQRRIIQRQQFPRQYPESKIDSKLYFIIKYNYCDVIKKEWTRYYIKCIWMEIVYFNVRCIRKCLFNQYCYISLIKPGQDSWGCQKYLMAIERSIIQIMKEMWKVFPRIFIPNGSWIPTWLIPQLSKCCTRILSKTTRHQLSICRNFLMIFKHCSRLKVKFSEFDWQQRSRTFRGAAT